MGTYGIIMCICGGFFVVLFIVMGFWGDKFMSSKGPSSATGKTINECMRSNINPYD